MTKFKESKDIKILVEKGADVGVALDQFIKGGLNGKTNTIKDDKK
jgi:hypothetical protein